MKKNLPLIILLSCVLCAPAAHSIDWNWAKNAGSKKMKKYQKTTNVAAVRGVEEPGDIDPDARDPEGLAWVESQNVPAEQAVQFIIDGKLKIRSALPPAEEKSGDPKKNLSQLASDIGKLSGQEKLANSARQITPEEELQIGKDVASNVIAQFGLVKNEALTRYVGLVGQSVARSSPRKEVAWRFAILDSPILNAFAAPGGYIFVTKGLLHALTNEAELACVLGHEIEHVSARHVVKEMQRSKMLAAIIPNYVKADAEKAVYMKQATDFAVSLMWKGLSREDELQADGQGVLFAYNTGYDPKCFADVLNTLKSKAQSASSKKELKFLLSTHPKPEDRLSAFQAKSASLPTGGERLESRFQQNASKI